MRRIVVYVLLLALTLVVPVQQVDVAHLRPIEVISLYKDGSTVVLKSDTQDIGRGDGVAAALEDMKQTAPAVIYLDTAQYLLIAENAVQEAEALRSVLKGAVRVCMAAENVTPEDAAAYLPAHGGLPRLRSWEAGDSVPILTVENGRMRLVKKD